MAIQVMYNVISINNLMIFVKLFSSTITLIIITHLVYDKEKIFFNYTNIMYKSKSIITTATTSNKEIT